MQLTTTRPIDVTVKKYPRSMTAEDFKAVILQAFPRVKTFNYCKSGANADSLVVLPENLAPAGFSKNVKKSRLIIVPTSLHPQVSVSCFQQAYTML